MVVPSTNSIGVDLFVALDKTSSTALHAQVGTVVREAIRDGRLVGGTALPATRRLADDLGISRGVVVEAYQQLTAEGYLTSEPGGYTRVAEGVTAPATAGQISTNPEPTIDLRYGRPDLAQFPRAAWLTSVRRVLTTTPHERLSYLDGRGAPELRDALAEYLNRVRGTWASADNVIVCNGFAQGWSMIAGVLAARGIRRLAVEDPSDDAARRAAQAAGLEVVGVGVTTTGIDVAALEASGARAVLVTPAHQFPTGALLSAEARASLLAWATATDSLVIEDDYDAEYRYDNTPVGALHGLAPDRVIYAGTASKTLAPGLRLGWLVAPAHLVADLASAKLRLDRGSPVIDQLTFADFLTRGELDRHLRRMRPIYRRRRDALLEALREHLPMLAPVGIAAGLHVFAWLPPQIPHQVLTERARARGIDLSAFDGYRLNAAIPDALIIGYGKAHEDQLRAAVAVMGEIVADAVGRG